MKSVITSEYNLSRYFIETIWVIKSGVNWIEFRKWIQVLLEGLRSVFGISTDKQLVFQLKIIVSKCRSAICLCYSCFVFPTSEKHAKSLLKLSFKICISSFWRILSQKTLGALRELFVMSDVLYHYVCLLSQDRCQSLRSRQLSLLSQAWRVKKSLFLGDSAESSEQFLTGL